MENGDGDGWWDYIKEKWKVGFVVVFWYREGLHHGCWSRILVLLLLQLVETTYSPSTQTTEHGHEVIINVVVSKTFVLPCCDWEYLLLWGESFLWYCLFSFELFRTSYGLLVLEGIRGLWVVGGWRWMVTIMWEVEYVIECKLVHFFLHGLLLVLKECACSSINNCF